jgi:hypothetical protein
MGNQMPRSTKFNMISSMSAMLMSSTFLLSTNANAQSTGFAPSINIYGTTGLIDMPTAESQPDAELNVTVSDFAASQRGTFTFQLSDRFSGSFRYTKLDNWINGSSSYDRSFDLQYRILNETDYRPAVAVGLRDFMGTGVYSGQYIVATKNIGSKFKLSGGLGWGRFSNSNKTQSNQAGDLGGKPLLDQWFTGPVGYFGGIEWQTPIERLRLKAEYSSDRYIPENEISGARTAATFDRKSPINFGLEYDTKWGAKLGAYYMYGSEIGFSITTALNPNRGRGIVDRAPRPVAVRKGTFDPSTSWTKISGITEKAHQQISDITRKDGISLEGISLSGNRAEVRIRNGRYITPSQAIGRTARALSIVLPDSVEEFVVIPMKQGLAVSAFKIQRSDLEAYENDPNGSSIMAQKVEIVDAPAYAEGEGPVGGLYPKFNWSLAPFVNIRIFDSKNPFAVSAGIRLSASYNPRPGLYFSGSIKKNLAHDDSFTPPGFSGLPRVRTDLNKYTAQGDPALEYLQAEYLFKLRPDIYGRVSAGILEKMYGGLSTELLWKPADQNWGLGVEVNYAKKRDYDQRLSFLDYSIVTGHVSGYYEMKNGYNLQLDVGRYLAGDLGGTISVKRTFGNGWKVGAYATLTDVPFDQFGEGSFDKGLSLEIPIGWVTGKPNRKTVSNTLASLTRDGGARLNVRNRLYGIVQDHHKANTSQSWARFWK